MERRPFDLCPACGEGKLVEREVEKRLEVGRYTITLTVRADVCEECGERLYSPEIARLWGEMDRGLEK
jgi:YgiT-type zinc finger domain-containing protein